MKKEGIYLPFVGMTGFEPATSRPPDERATGLRYIPFFLLWWAKISKLLICQNNVA